jgi:hypothetical protein
VTVGSPKHIWVLAGVIEDLEYLLHAVLSPIPSIHGDRAGNPIGNEADTALIKNQTKAWLNA